MYRRPLVSNLTVIITGVRCVKLFQTTGTLAALVKVLKEVAKTYQDMGHLLSGGSELSL